MRKVAYFCFCLFVSVSCFFAMSGLANALGEGGIGGGPGPGGGGSGGWCVGLGCFDCVTNGAHCPRWILMTREEYINILDEHDAGKERIYASEYYNVKNLRNICKHDKYVLVAGNQLLRDNGLTIWNYTSGGPFPYKYWHTYTSYTVKVNEDGFYDKEVKKFPKKVTINGVVTSEYLKPYGPWDNYPRYSMWDTTRGVLSWPTETKEKGYTYGSLLQYIMTSNHYYEQQLAVVCESMTKPTLSAYAIDVDGKSLEDGPIDSDQVNEEEPASVSMKDIDGYVFMGWRREKNSSSFVTRTDPNSDDYVSGEKNPKETFNVKSMTNDKSVYAVYDKSSFQGMIEAKSGVSSSTKVGYTKENKSAVHEIKDCSETDGCEVKFSYNLQRFGNFGVTAYEVKRYEAPSGIKTGTLKKAEESFSGNNPVEVYSETLTLYPGQTVCSSLVFGIDNTGTNKATLKICAMATGSAKAAISLAVRNTNVNKYNEYQKLVYAKPNDKLDYKSVYRASPQYAYAMIPIKLSINNGTEYNNPMSLITGTLFDNKNGCNSSDKKENCWNNAFSVTGDIFSEVYVYTKGDSSSKEKHKEPIVSNSYVGKTLKEQAKINGSDTGKTTPSQVDLKISDDKTGTLAKVYTEGLESEVVTVIVPYNFIALAEVTTDSDKVFTAGEKNQSVNYKLDITKKNNAETTNGADEAYATVARDVKSKVIFYTIDKEGLNGGEYESDSLCGYFRGATSCDDTRQDKEHGELSSSFETSFQFDVPDVPAGSKICIAAAIYPSSSGADTNIDKSGSKKWRISDSKCFIIGKKPTFQVWGGSFYGGGKIATASTTKDELAGGIEIPSGKVMVFGSWVEQTVVARGEIIELASGASSGLLNSPVKGGSPEVSKNYCRYRTVLSLANYSTDSGYCPNSQKAGNSGIAVDRVKLEDFVEVTEKTDTDVDIYGKIINKGETYIVNTSKDVKIHNDIKYAANSYSELDELPKAFIAASNIYIDCGVKQIDAFLIADNIIKTCGKDQNDINDKDHSNQLVVNGAISAGNLKLDRTFGAATGSYSSIPAEIVNYDASIILWMRNSVDTEEYNKMHQVYQHELAPRY